VCFYKPLPFCSWEGCNYCAGAVSPRLTDILRENDIVVPEEVIESRPTEITVHGDWKSIQLPVPEEREMLSVFRGSRPRQRTGRYANFDTFLLHLAADEDAEVITAEANHVYYSAEGKPVISYRTAVEGESDLPDRTIEADFAVFAGGVNPKMGMSLDSDPVLTSLRQMIPKLRPPKVRGAVITEMLASEEQLLSMDGEVHFMQYGSRNLQIEMASLMPKKEWITVVLIGGSVDRAQPSEYLQLVQRFIELPHIRRLLPPGVELAPRCSCHPSMTVRAAKHPFGNRVALVGDLAVSRLYKDGLYSAFATSAPLADCILERGVDTRTLARHYAPVVRAFDVDNRHGRVVFRLSHWVFSRPALSRILYEALIRERMTKPREQRQLAPVLWRTASGDDTYKSVLTGMLRPASFGLILTRGLLITLRNQVIEHLFGLDWRSVGRYSIGVPVEQVASTRRELFALQGIEPPSRAPHVERMFTIRIRARRGAITRLLGTFGEPDRQYLKPRFVQIRRVSGVPNQVGTVVRYHVPALRLTAHVALEEVVPDRRLVYRVVDGMGKGGIFAFVIDEMKPGVSLLTAYVAFDLPKGKGLGRLGWWLMRRVFPRSAHDVVWNHSLCEIKRLAEQNDQD
jgi:flavin-dependent dehydrogenase